MRDDHAADDAADDDATDDDATDDAARDGADDARRSSQTHRVIKGRRWRVTDPALGEADRDLLVRELMSARRAVKTALAATDADADADAALDAARARVHDAKVALGERGPEWWKEMTGDEVRSRIAHARRAFAAAGQPDLAAEEVRRRLHLPNVTDDA